MLLFLCSGWLVAAQTGPILDFQGISKPVFAQNAGGESIYNFQLKAAGYARASSAGGLLPKAGSWSAPGQGVVLRDRLKKHGAMTLSMVITDSDRGSRAPILLLGDTLGFWRSMGGLAFGVSGKEPLLLSGSPQKGPVHVAATSGEQGLVLYLNGKAVLTKPEFRTDFSSLSSADPQIGGGKAGWDGVMHTFTIHDAALSPTEMFSLSRKALALATVKPVTRLVMKGRLKAKSHAATLEEIAPYNASLAIYEYEVVSVSTGLYLSNRIRVAHWVVLGGALLPIRDLSEGDVVDLTVESFDDNPLKNVHLSDTLEIDFDLDLYYDVIRP